MRKEILDQFRRCGDKVSEAIGSEDLEREEYMGEGADGTPTKRIDEVAEVAALEHLQDNTDFSILSEEIGLVEQEGDGYVIMDPIDGTNNAIFEIPFYCISLAYSPSDLSEVEVGYVRNLSTGVEYHALKGEGAFKGGSPLNPESGDDMTVSLYLGKNAVPESYEIAPRARRVRSLGSAALSMCMVAEGTFDLFYHRTPDEQKSLRIMDIAASTLILREVGGEVYGKDGEKLNMEISPVDRKDVIAIYDEEIKEELL
ncbi:MAG: inositol monophosphatase [Candidatus Thermoplasmatota archaeon]|nr:inositol monophosphatase [Candidatus Thermoplasmatota archaeon]